MNLKELVKQAIAAFSAPPATASTATDPGNQAPSDTSGATVYTLQDGSQIAVQQAGDTPAPGDMVTIAGAPAPEGILTLQDGSMITCDATGTVTLYTPVGGAPVTTDVPGADAKQPAPAAAAPTAGATPAKPAMPAKPGATGYSETDKALLLAAVDSAEGSDFEAVAKICLKALMQSEFGWQILEQQRLADANAAIAVYKNVLAASTQKAEAFAAKQTALELENTKLKATITSMFEILEKIAEQPTASPKTITSAKKDEFESKEIKNQEKFQKIADSLKTVKANA